MTTEPRDYRICTLCQLKHSLRVPALYVATASDHMQWFECGSHARDEHPEGHKRAELEKLSDFLQRVTAGRAS